MGETEADFNPNTEADDEYGYPHTSGPTPVGFGEPYPDTPSSEPVSHFEREPQANDSPEHGETEASTSEHGPSVPSLEPEDHLANIAEKFGIEISKLEVKFGTTEFGRFDADTGILYHETSDGKEVNASDLFKKSASGQEQAKFETRLEELAADGVSYDQNIISKNETEIIVHLVVNGIYYTATFTAKTEPTKEAAKPKTEEPDQDQDDYKDPLVNEKVRGVGHTINPTKSSGVEKDQTPKTFTVAKEIEPVGSGIELQGDVDGGEDVVAKPEAEKSFVVPVKNLSVIKNPKSLEQPLGLATDSFEAYDESTDAEALKDADNQTREIAETSAVIVSAVEKGIRAFDVHREAISMAEDSADFTDTDSGKTEILGLEGKIVIRDAEKNSTDVMAVIGGQANGIELLAMRDEDGEAGQIIAEAEKTPEPELLSQPSPALTETSGITLFDDTELKVVEAAQETEELKEVYEISQTTQIFESAFSIADKVDGMVEHTALQPEAEDGQTANEIIGRGQIISNFTRAEISISGITVVESTAATIIDEPKIQKNQPPEVANVIVEATGISLVETSDTRAGENLQTNNSPESKVDSSMDLEKAASLRRSNSELAKIIKATDSGIKIETSQTGEQEENNQTVRSETQRQGQTAEVTRPAIQIDGEKIPAMAAVKEPIKDATKTPSLPAIKPDSARSVESNVRTIPVGRLASSSVTGLSSQRRVTPISTNEAALKSAEIETNQQTSKKENLPPVAVTSPRSNLATFKSAELTNRTLTFNPSALSSDDVTTNNNTEAYLPEFELAA